MTLTLSPSYSGERGSRVKARAEALAGVAQCIEHGPVNQSVAGSIPSWGTCLGCSQVPSKGRMRDNHTL